MWRLRTWLLLGVTACGASDYGVRKVETVEGPVGEAVDLRLDVSFQEQEWGQQTTRCQVQAAFEPLPEFADPAAAAAGEDSSAGETADAGEPVARVAEPRAPGECAFSEVVLEEPTEPGGSGDNWQLSGEVVGPERVWLEDELGVLTLSTTDTEHAGLRYEVEACDLDGFPFGRTLDLEVPESDDPDGVLPFRMSQIVAVPPRLILEAPVAQAHGQPELDPADGLFVGWTLAGPDPLVDGVRVPPEVRVAVRSQDRDRQAPVRWLVCWPDADGFVEIDPDTLAPLADGRTDPAVWTTHVDVHATVLGRPVETALGELKSVRSHVSTGAGVALRPR